MTVPVKQLIIDYYRETRQAWIEAAREKAKEFAKTYGEVCADDIHRVCPMPEDIDRRTMGHVFSGFRFIRYKKSARSECHHRSIAVFGAPE